LNVFLSAGAVFQEAILYIAGSLKDESVPGLVSMALVIALLLTLGCLYWKVSTRQGAIDWLNSLLINTEKQVNFSQQIDSLTATIHSEAATAPRISLATAWGKYRETLVPHDEGGATILRNSIRPAAFLNLDDLGFSAGAWRIGAGLFVTVGLFLTFLGLVSALNSMTQGASITSGAMSDLLKIASAKFIMSLTGLFCSIIFTLVFRLLFGRLDKSIHRLCASLEKRLAFISLEALAVEQLAAIREQREHVRKLGFELVAEFNRPLREELPAAISSSIRSAMTPLMDQVGKMGSDGMEGMVKNLSSQLAEDVGRSLTAASERLAEAGAQIKHLADRMDQSSGRMGAEMETSIASIARAVGDLRESVSLTAEKTEGAFSRGAEQLLDAMNRTLEGIRDNTGEGARAMSAAAGEMRGAAEGFRKELETAAETGAHAAHARMRTASSEASDAIGTAGSQILDAFGRTSEEINRVVNAMTEKAGTQLLAPLDEVSEKLRVLVAALAEGSSEMRRMAEGVKAGGEASVAAAGTFRSASTDLANATVPIRTTTERMEASLRILTESTHHVATTVSRSAESTARSAADALAAAKQVMSAEARAMESTMANISGMLEQMKGQGERLDDIDGKLGRAFDIYNQQVAAAVDTMFGHVRDLQNKLGPALDTMREIVDQAQQFAPESRVQ
jgi:ABC-type transporter Mla subunit MlaD